MRQSELLGRGGAAFPTWAKWDGAAKAADQPKYFVVNADESEPGTFKDRVLLEGDPCRVLEGAIIGAYAIGAVRIYIYIRGEYPLAKMCIRDRRWPSPASVGWGRSRRSAAWLSSPAGCC